MSGSSYLRLSGAALAAVTQAACSAKQAADPYQVLQDDEARDFIAIAARIIPTTATPGATEAGVIYFFDNAFATLWPERLATARQGLAEFNASLSAAGHAAAFHELTDDQQDDFLRSQERGSFFGMLREMTIMGFFAMSSYGGNKDHVSWDLIGFKGHNGGWSYPFGYYDAEHARENADGE